MGEKAGMVMGSGGLKRNEIAWEERIRESETWGGLS
jgi:hypothetical protein